MAHVHATCLNKWVRMKPNKPTVCELCNTPLQRQPLLLPRLPLEFLLVNPFLLLLGWGVLHGWSLLPNPIHDSFSATLYILHSAYYGIPYGLICITTLYVGSTVIAIRAIQQPMKNRYFSVLRSIECGNEHFSMKRIGSVFYCVLFLLGLFGSFAYPLPSVVLVLSMLPEIPRTHTKIVGILNKELLDLEVIAERHEDSSEDSDEDSSEDSSDGESSDEEIVFPA